MNIYIHNKSKTVVKLVRDATHAIALIKQLTVVFEESFYITTHEVRNDVWSKTYDK